MVDEAAWFLGGRVLNCDEPFSPALAARALRELEAAEEEWRGAGNRDPWLRLVQIRHAAGPAFFDWCRDVLLRRWPDVDLAWDVEGPPPAELVGLRGVRALRFRVGRFADLGFLAAPAPSLVRLTLCQPSGPRLDLHAVQHLAGLEALALGGKIAPLAAIAALPELRQVSLVGGFDKRDLAPLLALPRLESLGLFGGVCDVATLARLGRLRELEISLPRGLSDIGFLRGCDGLERLRLHGIGEVRELPELGHLAALREVHLHAAKRLTDLSPLAALPALHTLAIGGPSVAEVEDLECFVGHPTLRVLRVWFAGKARRQRFAEWRRERGLHDGRVSA
ncbi:MAG: hypothetical protein KDE27_13005 [Planctomycetes bacterium]|nr:hypothetical protein [Planctomycetota bacterium]